MSMVYPNGHECYERSEGPSNGNRIAKCARSLAFQQTPETPDPSGAAQMITALRKVPSGRRPGKLRIGPCFCGWFLWR